MNDLEPLWRGLSGDDERSAVTVRWMPAGTSPRSACVVFPGGGYANHADHEAEPVGRWLNSLNISAAVVRYRVAPHRHPGPLQDAAEAVRRMREIVGDIPVGVLGFSAGGHLASVLSTHWQETTPGEKARPDYAVLCYPVIHLITAAAHLGSRQNLLGDTETPDLLAELSSERQVTPLTPPTFLWHTAEDAAVNPANSLMYAEALREQGVPFELHVFERGYHGLGLCERSGDPPEVRHWMGRCADWLHIRGYGDLMADESTTYG